MSRGANKLGFRGVTELRKPRPRGGYYVTYSARVQDGKFQKYIGCFDSPEIASTAIEKWYTKGI